MELQKTFLYEHFIGYYNRAKVLQDNCNISDTDYNGELINRLVGDDLQQNIHIYDTVERKYAGFSNVPMDLWHRERNPKYFKQNEDRRQLIGLYQTENWNLVDWLYAFIFHRCTGSGASFENDHGYRNSLCQYFGMHRDMSMMVKFLKAYVDDNSGPLFTSIGNQPPGFKNGGVDYFLNDLPDLCRKLANYIQGDTHSVKEVVDFMNQWNIDRGFKRFTFVYTAVAMDISDFFTEYVPADSKIYYGSNAKRCISLIFNKPPRTNQQKFMEAASDIIQADTGGYAKDTEDVFCDFVRYMNNYIPISSKTETYNHLVGKIKNKTGVDPSELPDWAQKYGN